VLPIGHRTSSIQNEFVTADTVASRPLKALIAEPVGAENDPTA